MPVDTFRVFLINCEKSVFGKRRNSFGRSLYLLVVTSNQCGLILASFLFYGCDHSIAGGKLDSKTGNAMDLLLVFPPLHHSEVCPFRQLSLPLHLWWQN